ncbi:MBL fold metallo-hydrolase [Compostibacter hankyongensis]|uniref:MBL fold metallo-hydrolase n=1 Tax=Compostibacter hankyongensis TaxID=1007089 RepID=A0ABP8FEC9_9BACT
MLTIHSFLFNPFQENTYLLLNEKKECIIIDPGCYFENERNELVGFITTRGLQPRLLLNTHAHLDHIFGNYLVSQEWGLRPRLHRLELPVLERSPEAGNLYGTPFAPSPEPEAFLEEGKAILFGEDELEVILAPGHSPGSLCFYCPAQQFLIGGDVLFRESVGRADLPGGDYDTLVRSIETRLYVLDDAVTVYPGHGPATTIGHEKRHNPFVRG